MFLNVNLRLIFLTLPILPSHVSSPRPTNNILVTYGALQVLYCIVLTLCENFDNAAVALQSQLTLLEPSDFFYLAILSSLPGSSRRPCLAVSDTIRYKVVLQIVDNGRRKERTWPT